MAVALGAIQGFLHFLTDDWVQHDESPRHIVTVLDVLEPRSPQG